MARRKSYSRRRRKEVRAEERPKKHRRNLERWYGDDDRRDKPEYTYDIDGLAEGRRATRLPW